MINKIRLNSNPCGPGRDPGAVSGGWRVSFTSREEGFGGDAARCGLKIRPRSKTAGWVGTAGARVSAPAWNGDQCEEKSGKVQVKPLRSGGGAYIPAKRPAIADHKHSPGSFAARAKAAGSFLEIYD